MAAKYVFDREDVHSCMLEACKEFYKNPDHDQVIENATEALLDFVREKSEHPHLSEVDELLDTVFHKEKPILAFSTKKQGHDKEVQEAMLLMMKGVLKSGMTKNNRKFFLDDHDKALNYLAMINSIANHIEKAKKMELE